MTSPFDPNLPPDYPVGPKRIPYLEADRDPTPLDSKYRSGNWYEFNTEWRNKAVNPPRIWKLAAIYSRTNALWQLVSGGSSGVITSLRGDDGAIASPNLGIVDVLGFVVPNGTNAKAVWTDNTTTPNTSRIEVQLTTTAGSANDALVGLSLFDETQFNVTDGFVTLKGGSAAIDEIGVDATSGTGTNPVLPNPVNGRVTVNGALVASGSNPVRSVSTAPFTYQVQVQTTQALAASDSTKVGLANFSSMDFNVDANGFVQAKASQAAVGVRNIGFTYNGGTGVFTVCAQDGSALSASNPGYVTLQDRSNPGLLMTIAVTANQDFIDDVGASEIIGNLFGLTTSIATTVDIPFFVYAVTNDAESAISFMISRFPNATTSPVAAKIGKPGTTAASTQGSFFALENITETDYDSNPCVSIGSFRMTMSAANDWTVVALASRDGVGHYQEGLQFSFPRGQFGAATGKVFKNNGGTAPDDADGGYTYYIDSENNRIYWQLAFPALDTAGVGAVTTQLAAAFNRLEGATSGTGFTSVGGVLSSLTAYTQPTTNNIEFVAVNHTATAFQTNAALVLGSTVSANGTMAIDFS